MSNTVYVVQYRSMNNGVWERVNPIDYCQYREAVDKMTDESVNDPEYSHRVVAVRRREAVVAEISGIVEIEEADDE